jgi:aminoglycoside phosphotransferase family enzyme
VHAPGTLNVPEPGTAEKLALLGQPGAYSHAPPEVAIRETHMSWVFLAGDRVYKLKKPVRFPFLDFSTLARREAACRAELALNRRLARDVYLDVVPLTANPGGLAIGGDGRVVDWLVVMRRLAEGGTLEQAILSGSLARTQLDDLVSVLTRFYRTARRVFISPELHLAGWRRNLAFSRRILLEPRLGLPAGLIRHLDGVQRRFLAERGELLGGRALGRHIVDGHGDLRPEHIWLDHPVRIIDCLEFNASLRAVDPLDEAAFLSLECERLGGLWAADYLCQRMTRALQTRFDDPLFAFYRCYRATLRARLAIAHLLEPDPRTPEKWPRLARTYLRLAQADARRIERALRAPFKRPSGR